MTVEAVVIGEQCRQLAASHALAHRFTTALLSKVSANGSDDVQVHDLASIRRFAMAGYFDPAYFDSAYFDTGGGWEVQTPPSGTWTIVLSSDGTWTKQ